MREHKAAETGNEREACERELLAIRDRWNIARHPFYTGIHDGTVSTAALAHLLAQQYHHIVSVLPSLSLIYYKAPDDQRDFILTQLLSEGGKGGDAANREPSSVDYILRFCEAEGISRTRVMETLPFPAWRARALYNINVAHEEPFACYMAMKSVTEGQQWALNRNVILPALQRAGYANDDPRIDFFARHFISNEDFGNAQVSIAAAMLSDARMRARAVALAEETGRLYWASVNDVYRAVVLGQVDPTPAGVRAPGTAERS